MKESLEVLRDLTAEPIKSAASDAVHYLPRSRVIEILNNFADGTYQAIAPDVVGEAARHLQNSEPVVEGILEMTDDEALAAGIVEYGSEEAWRAAMAALRNRMLTTVHKVAAFDDMLAALRQAKWLTNNINEFGALTDFAPYDAACDAIDAAIAKATPRPGSKPGTPNYPRNNSQGQP